MRCALIFVASLAIVAGRVSFGSTEVIDDVDLRGRNTVRSFLFTFIVGIVFCAKTCLLVAIPIGNFDQRRLSRLPHDEPFYIMQVSFTCDGGCRVYSPTSNDQIVIVDNTGRELTRSTKYGIV